MVTGLLSSVPEEGTLLNRQLKKKSTVSGRQFFMGRIGDTDVVSMVSGMGKTNAAHAATILLEKFLPDRIILFGVGGAYPSSGLRVGDIAVAEKEVYGDEGVLTSDGFRDTGLIGIPLLKKAGKKYFNEFVLNKILVRKALKSFHNTPCHLPSPARIKSGTFVTVSSCTGTRERARVLKKRFGAICENMEGAAVAHICTLYDAPVLELRGISNIVEDRDRAAWDVMLASENCQKIVEELLRDF